MLYTVFTRLGHVILDTWHLTPALSIYTGTWYLHRHTAFDTDICHAIFDTDFFHADTCYAICDTWYPTPVLAMLYLTYDTRYWYLSCYTYHLILDTDTWCDILDTCSWHPVYDMLSCGTNTWTWHRDSWPDTTTQIPVYYMTYSWLSLLRGHDLIIILLP